MKLKEKENRILFGLKQFGINEADGWKRFYLNGDAFEKILKKYPYWKFKQFLFDEPIWKHFNGRYPIQINNKYLRISQKDLNTKAIQVLSIVELKKYIRKFPNSCLIRKTPIGLEFHIEGRGWIITDGKEKFSFVVHGYGSKEDNLFIPNHVFCNYI